MTHLTAEVLRSGVNIAILIHFFYMRTVPIRNTGTGVNVGKILCVGRNYAEHAKEMNAEVPEFPVVFLKPPSALLLNGEPIIRPKISKSLHHEVELVVVIGMEGKNIPLSEARSHILGYAVGLDMTLRDVQAEAKKKGLPWAIAKGFDTSAPLSEIIPSASLPDPSNVELVCKVNGAVRQRSSTRNMIFPVDRLISELSTIFTLEPGDLIFTGTPEGVGEVVDGDTIEAELVGFTRISHHVKAA